MDKKVVELNKRLKGDMMITLIVTVVMAFIGVAQTINFFMKGDITLLKRGIQAIVMMLPLLIVYLILKRIEKTGKPFDEKIVKMLRILAFMIIIAGVLPTFVETFANLVRFETFTVEFNGFDLFIPLLGVIIGIISEIFVYGKELQEDNDLIA